MIQNPKGVAIMRDTITYEWCIESQDEFGDIASVNHADSLAEAIHVRDQEAPDWHKVEIALSRTEGNDYDGINWRGYAYLHSNGTLEPVFSSCHTEEGGLEDGPNVPQRFLKETIASGIEI
jgi:hypothetical protein